MATSHESSTKTEVHLDSCEMNLTPFLGKPRLYPCLLFVAFITFTTIFSGHNLIYILRQQFDHTQQEVEQPKQQYPRSEKGK